MTKQAWLVVFVFVVALGSGMLLGMGVARTTHGEGRSSWIESELKLTPQQREQMRTIWQGMLRTTDQHGWEKRRELQKQRDESIVALLTPEQKAAYDKLQQKYTDDVAALSAQREAAFKAAVEKTRAILSPSQRTKYDDLLAKGFHGPWGGRGPGPMSAPASGPAGGRRER